MRDRRARLARIVALFEVEKRVKEARVARIARDELTLVSRAKELLELIACRESAGLERAAAGQISKNARDRAIIGRKLEAETAARRKAELRARVAEQALKKIEVHLDDRTQRALLEEMQFAAPPASGKFRGPKV